MALAQVERLTFSYPGRGAARAQRRLARSRAGRDRRAARPVGLRQVDAPARAGRARPALPRRPVRGPGRGRRTRHPPLQPGRARRTRSPRCSRTPRTRSSSAGSRTRSRSGSRTSARRRRRSGRACTARSPTPASRTSRSGAPRRSRPASSSASASRPSLRSAPRCCSSTSRPRSSTPREPRRFSTWRASWARRSSSPSSGRRCRSSAATACSSSRTDDSRSTRPATRLAGRGSIPAYLPRPAAIPSERGGEGESSRQGRQRQLLVRLRAGSRRRLARAPAGRGRRAHRPERRRQDDAREDRRPGCWSPRRAKSSVTDASATCRRIPAATSSPSAPSDEASLAVGGDLVRARAALARVGLAGSRAAPSARPLERRAGAARARQRARRRADVLVLDEPTRGVDPPRKSELAELLRRESARPRDARRHARPRLRGRRRRPRRPRSKRREPARA